MRREERGLTQVQLAKAIDFDRSSLSNIESGNQRILAHTLKDIADALKTTVMQLTKAI